VCIGFGDLDSLATLLFISLPGKKFLIEDCLVGVHLLEDKPHKFYSDEVKRLFKEHTKLETLDGFANTKYLLSAKDAHDLGFCDKIISK
jgi:hypothetical protein